MEIKRTKQLSAKLKNVRFDGDGALYDEDGIILDLNRLLFAAFGNEAFTISVSCKDEDSYLVEEGDGGLE